MQLGHIKYFYIIHIIQTSLNYQNRMDNLLNIDTNSSGLNKKHQVGRTSLSLALGNMAVARQILLIFNLSYLPCFVQFVTKKYCQAKNDLFETC